MATLYLSFADGDNADTGGSWAAAYQTLKEAVEQCVADNGAGPHTILWDHSTPETLGADTPITAVCDLRIISVNRSGSDAPTAGAAINTQTTNYALTFAGPYKIYFSGITFKNGTSTTNKSIAFGASDGAHYEFENCAFHVAGGTASVLLFGSGSAGFNTYFRIKDCEWRFTNAAQIFRIYGRGEFIGCVPASGTTALTTHFQINSFVDWKMEGCDLSSNTTKLLGDNAGGGPATIVIANCKLGVAAADILTDQTVVLMKGAAGVWAFNCSSGDTHYALFHGDPFGTTTVTPDIYANDGAQYDGTNRCSWVITTTANTSFFTPYVSPWIDKYHAGTSAITPSLEILRDGSATAYQDDEVWGEWSYQGTTGFPLALFVNDRMALLGTPANQGAGVGLAGWTGETTTGAPDAWSGKLAPASTITPAEIGHLRARVVVGEPGITVYVDPKIRV